jgi:hypothetical protein
VHAVIATTPLDADAETLARIAATQGRITAAPDERYRPPRTVSAVLAHPLFEAARIAERAGAVSARRPSPSSTATR